MIKYSWQNINKTDCARYEFMLNIMMFNIVMKAFHKLLPFINLISRLFKLFITCKYHATLSLKIFKFIIRIFRERFSTFSKFISSLKHIVPVVVYHGNSYNRNFP